MAGGVASQALRYLVGGAANTVLSIGLYYFLQLFMHYQIAYAIAFVFGIVLSYAINLRFVFKTQHTRSKALAFPLVYLAQYVAGALLLGVLVEWVGVPKEIAPIAVAILTIPLTFGLLRLVLRPR